MSRQVIELETILQQLITEHTRLLAHVDAHQAAMRKLDLRAMDDAAKVQEACRLRIAQVENRRRAVVKQLALILRIDGEPTLARIAAAVPQMKQRLLEHGAKLKALAQKIAGRITIASRVAGALLGHLNTVVRIVAGAVEQAGVYTKDGVPKVTGRIGVMEAVG